MTIMACPHGCGGTVDTGKDNWCPSCRRGLNETEVLLPEDTAKTELNPDGNWIYPGASPVQRKASWCWEWWGPSNHRMRCRLPIGHSGDHWDHEEPPSGGETIVAADGQVIDLSKNAGER